jgi:hydrophobic/amphiphilic exporter-1 (mainly G- bacteria), HAE1 family
MNLSSLFIRRPIMTTLMMIAILFFGVVAYNQLPVSDLPNVNYPAITVSVNYPGSNPTTVANTVVSPLEREFLTIGGLKTIASTSSTGSATIVLQFDLKKTIDSAALDVQNAINTATPNLPQDLPYAPTYSKVNPSQTPILYFAVNSHTMPLYQLYDYAYTFIGERISTVSGVAQIQVYGSPFAVRVQVNPQKLTAKGIGLDEVASAIQNSNVTIPTGTLYGQHQEYTINVDGQMDKASLYNQLIIKNDKGNIVRIRDIGRAIDSLSSDKEYQRYLTSTESINSVIFGVLTQPGVNSMQVISDINDMLPQLKAHLPGSVELVRIFDKSEFIKESLLDVQMTLIIAFSLVVCVIFLYLGKPMNTLIPAIALPICIIGTFALMSILGFTIDILSLLAITLSVGFLVDDAIVVLENIVRHVQMGKTPLEAAFEGSKEISFTILSMTLSLAAVFLPLLFMGGVIGQLFHEFAVVIVSAILLSGFISLTLTPMLCSRLVQPYHLQSNQTSMEKVSSKVNTSLLSIYEKGLNCVLRFPKTTLGAGAVCIVLTLILFKSLPTNFLPPDDIGQIVIHTQAATGTSPFEMMRIQSELDQIARNNPAVESMISLGAIPDDNKGIMFIRLKPYKERPSVFKVIDDLQKSYASSTSAFVYIKPLPLIDLQVSTTDINAPYQYTLQSLSTQDLYPAASQMLKAMEHLPRLSQISTDMEIKQPQLNLNILRDRAYALDVSAQALENVLSYAFAATNLSPINDPQNQYYVIMEVEPKFYSDPSFLSQLYIRAYNNKLIPLSAVTRPSQTVGPLNINLINGLPAVNLFFDIGTGALGPALKELETLAAQTLPSTVTGTVQGTADVFKASFANLNVMLLIALFAIYIILGILYENFLHPITVMSTLPPAALGGLLTLLIFQEPFSLYTFVGIILLLGIVMKNGIIMIDFANDSILAGKTPEEAIIHACITRFRPILMTTFSALMGAVPIAMGLGGMTAQGRRSLGLVIIGGLIVSQILTLYLTPVLYLYLEKIRQWIHKKNKV